MESDVFEIMYKKGVPPWDIAGPQPEIEQLAGDLKSPILDVGCGTGENALYVAGLGHEVLGIDIVPAAIEKALAKASERSLAADFRVWNAMKLQDLGRKFNSVIDSGFFHTLSDEERPAFAETLASVLNPGGKYFMLCFSEFEPGSWGPRRVTQQEIRDTFGQGWQIDFIRPMRFHTNLDDPQCCKGWLSSIMLARG
jgi:cyclopropane fatty-acyl-phospholipid synthase-like methyltransferase